MKLRWLEIGLILLVSSLLMWFAGRRTPAPETPATDASAFLHAVEGNQLDTVQAMAEARPELVNCGQAGQRRPLCVAAAQDLPEMVTLLLELGADPNGVGEFGTSPLHYAASVGHTGCVELLLEGGADPNFAAERGVTPLHAAANAGSVDALERLVAHGGKPETEDQFGATPLFFAVRAGQGEAVAYLLSAGADPDHGCSGQTPRQAALDAGNQELASLLAKHGGH